MRISVPCNWLKSLTDVVEAHPEIKKNVFDFFGSTDESFTGTGRPFFLVKKMSRQYIQDYIETVHNMGLKFTWLWNGECLGYFKFKASEQERALAELRWLEDIGVEFITVTDPYLAEFIRTYSNLTVKASVITEVNSVSRALDWQEIIGPKGVLTISFLANRNFPLLYAIKKAVKCDLELLVSDCCLQDCPYRFFHYTECSHSSQYYDPLHCYYNDWANIACQNQKGFHYEQILMCRWIQPNDLEKYIQKGYDYFKISGRRFTTDWIFRALKAYSGQSYNDNLGDIFDGYSFISDPLEHAAPQYSELAARFEKTGGRSDLQGTMLNVPDFKGNLKASELKSFITNFPHEGGQCNADCGVTCFYCFKYAEKAFEPPLPQNEKKYRDVMAYIHQYLSHGEGFLPDEERVLKSPIKSPTSESYTGFQWASEARDLFEKVMIIVPKEYQSAAKAGIGFTAERTAEKLGAQKVEKDLLISIVLKVVPPQFKHDAYDFLLEQQIDPNKFLTSEQIEEIKMLSYGTQEMADKAKARGEEVIKPAAPLIAAASAQSNLNLSSQSEWKKYLEIFMKVYNELPELATHLKSIAPLIFQYQISDKPEMSYWQFFTEEKVLWGLGSRDEPNVPKIIHKTTFQIMQGVNSGATNPVEAMAQGKYFLEGDMAKLMACTPIIPLNSKAHAKVLERWNTDLNLEKLQDDIVKAAEVAEVSYDKEKIWPVLNAYQELFLKSAISFVTSTKPKEKRALSFRYVNVDIPHNPHSIALEKGFISKYNHPIDGLFTEIETNYPVMGHGIDVNVKLGLTKIWTFFQIPQSLEKAYAMASLPKSIKGLASYFKKYDLDVFHLFALDYGKKTVNLYFMVKNPGKFPPKKVAGMLEDLGFKVPSQEVLDYCSKALTIYYTFTWDSPRAERLCFGVVAPERNQIPTHLHPLIKQYVENAPILTKNRIFIYGITFSPTGDYIKVENDYNGLMTELMKRGAQAEVWLDEMKKRMSDQIKQQKNTIIWEPSILELFEKIVSGVPEAFRQIVKPLLRETAEKKCQKGTSVSEADLITALFEITPDPFKPEAIKNLNALGIDYQKYIKL